MGRPKVLLVEDNPGDVLLVRKALDHVAKVELQIASDGVEALQRLRQTEVPDLVLLDLNLPRVSGYEVLSEVKADPRLGLVPVVVLTGSSDQWDVDRVYSLRGNAYFVKPGSTPKYRNLARVLVGHWLELGSLPSKKV